MHLSYTRTCHTWENTETSSLQSQAESLNTIVYDCLFCSSFTCKAGCLHSEMQKFAASKFLMQFSLLQSQHFFRICNKLESTSVKKPLPCHYKMIYSLSSIIEGEELNGLTIFLNATHMCSPAFQLNWQLSKLSILIQGSKKVLLKYAATLGFPLFMQPENLRSPGP